MAGGTRCWGWDGEEEELSLCLPGEWGVLCFAPLTVSTNDDLIKAY